MSGNLNTPLEYRHFTTSLSVANGTAAKILVDCQLASVAAAVPGEVALPGEVVVRQRVRQGGARIIGGAIASTDGTARSVLFYIAECLTTQDAATTGVLALTTGSATRAAGSFVTDGWRIGDSLMLFGPVGANNVGSATQANVGALAQVTAVSALALTVAGTPFTADAALPSGARLFRVALRTRRAVAANAGNADATPPVVLMGGTQDPASANLPDTGWELGANNALIVAVTAAVSAAPARLDFLAEGALR